MSLNFTVIHITQNKVQEAQMNTIPKMEEVSTQVSLRLSDPSRNMQCSVTFIKTRAKIKMETSWRSWRKKQTRSTKEREHSPYMWVRSSFLLRDPIYNKETHMLMACLCS